MLHLYSVDGKQSSEKFGTQLLTFRLATAGPEPPSAPAPAPSLRPLNSASVIKKGFNFLCPEDLFVGTFNILPRGLPSQPPAAPPLPADNLPGLASISVKLYGEERGERRENKTCPAKSDLSQEHDDTTPHRTAQRKREIDEIKCKN